MPGTMASMAPCMTDWPTSASTWCSAPVCSMIVKRGTWVVSSKWQGFLKQALQRRAVVDQPLGWNDHALADDSPGQHELGRAVHGVDRDHALALQVEGRERALLNRAAQQELVVALRQADHL